MLSDATFAAAVLAASVAVVGLIWSVISWMLTHSQVKELSAISAKVQEHIAGREQWWKRFEWSVAQVASPDLIQQRAGLESLYYLVDADWASSEDNLLALAVTQALER